MRFLRLESSGGPIYIDTDSVSSLTCDHLGADQTMISFFSGDNLYCSNTIEEVYEKIVKFEASNEADRALMNLISGQEAEQKVNKAKTQAKKKGRRRNA